MRLKITIAADTVTKKVTLELWHNNQQVHSQEVRTVSEALAILGVAIPSVICQLEAEQKGSTDERQ